MATKKGIQNTTAHITKRSLQSTSNQWKTSNLEMMINNSIHKIRWSRHSTQAHERKDRDISGTTTFSLLLWDLYEWGSLKSKGRFGITNVWCVARCTCNFCSLFILAKAVVSQKRVHLVAKNFVLFYLNKQWAFNKHGKNTFIAGKYQTKKIKVNRILNKRWCIIYWRGLSCKITTILVVR